MSKNMEVPKEIYDALVNAAEMTVKMFDGMLGQAMYGVKDGRGRDIDLTNLNQANYLAESALNLIDPQRVTKLLAVYEAKAAARDAG